MSVSYSGNSSASTRRTRDELVREYASQNARRARDARTHSNDAMETHRASSERAKQRRAQRDLFDKVRKEEEALNAQRRAQQRDLQASEARTDAGVQMHEARMRQRSKISGPISSQEFKEKTRRSYEHYEKERAARDALQNDVVPRGNRKVIDGRGTIDSRTFNEKQIISSKTINDQDRHDPSLSTTTSLNRWKTRSGTVDLPKHASQKRMNLDFAKQKNLDSFSDFPPFVKVSIPIIIILLLIVIFLLFR